MSRQQRLRETYEGWGMPWPPLPIDEDEDNASSDPDYGEPFEVEGTLQAAKLLLCVGRDVFAWKRRDSLNPDEPLQDLDVPGGWRKDSDTSIGATLLREIQEEIHLHPEDHKRLRSLIQSHPSGCSELQMPDGERNTLTLPVYMHVWALQVSNRNANVIHITNNHPESGAAEGMGAGRYPRHQLLDSIDERMPNYGFACIRALARSDALASGSLRLHQEAGCLRQNQETS